MEKIRLISCRTEQDIHKKCKINKSIFHNRYQYRNKNRIRPPMVWLISQVVNYCTGNSNSYISWRVRLGHYSLTCKLPITSLLLGFGHVTRKELRRRRKSEIQARASHWRRSKFTYPFRLGSDSCIAGRPITFLNKARIHVRKKCNIVH